jgi:hypothetical protein
VASRTWDGRNLKPGEIVLRWVRLGGGLTGLLAAVHAPAPNPGHWPPGNFTGVTPRRRFLSGGQGIGQVAVRQSAGAPRRRTGSV